MTARPLRVIALFALAVALACTPRALATTAAGADLRTLVDRADSAHAAARDTFANNPDDATAAAPAFRDAAHRYERVIAAAQREGIRSAAIHYNRGNALLMAGDAGRAIAAYLRAERLDPTDRDIQHNLRVARARVATQIDGAADGVDAPPAALAPFVWAHRALDGRAKLWTFIAAAAVFWLILAARLIDRRAVARRVAVIPFAVALSTSASVAADVLGARPELAVVVDAPATARSGPGESYGPRFTAPLSPGVELIVNEQRGDWMRVTLADRRDAWLPASAVERVDSQP